MPTNPTPDLNCRYGAPMGRFSLTTRIDWDARLYLRRVPLDSGGYDRGGAYWGRDIPLYACGDGDDWVFLRARDRDAAKLIIREEYAVDAKFWR